MNLKKAAMFGLDARIALAIFGTLSVISSASLYGAIKEAKIVKNNTNIQNLIKALEQYYLDNQRTLPRANSQELNIGDLLVNRENLNTWSGPYISGAIEFVDNRNITFNISGQKVNTQLDLRTKSSDYFSYCTTSDKDCYAVLEFQCISAADKNACSAELEPLDKHVDGADDLTTGKFVKRTISSVDYYYYQTIPYDYN